MNREEVHVGTGYPSWQLAKAFTTASSHEDPATRRRAEERLHRWEQVVRGMAAGTLTIGSRTPVAGLPAWVTPEVVRGGFATGEAAAGGPLLPHEIATARGAGVPADRHALFRHHLTDAGLAELYALLDGGAYEVALPEEAALLTVAWLLRSGDRDAALTLLEQIHPFADRLRFAPRPVAAPPPSSAGDAVVHRETVGEVHAALDRRRPHRAITAMNEALTVWNPFADELLAHWLKTVESDRFMAGQVESHRFATGQVQSRRVTAGLVGAVDPDGWRERGADLLARYRRLAVVHTLCTKHRRPKENLTILRTALEERVAGRDLTPRLRGLLQHAVDSMVRRRGVPGSPEHTTLREAQAITAARPTLHALAQVLVARLADLPPDAGLPSVDETVAPVTEEEARTGAAAGSEIPDPLRRVVERALSAPIATLVERGVVPSAEVLAELVPQLVAVTTAEAYEDAALRALMAAVYRAFRNRRSLLLLNLEHQVRLEELPWVAAVTRYRSTTKGGGQARVALVRLGELALQGFPGTVLPNPLIQELSALARQAGVDVPFTEELAADIFMGAFSPKFGRAARLAADVLEGTLYERYYGIDYAAVRGLADPDRFAAVCRGRAGDRTGGSWVAANGMMIEQAQILTTHNLAALVHPIGVYPSGGWPELARRAFTTVCRLVTRIHGNPRPLTTIKDAAYAWRQTLFFLSLCGLEDQIAVIAWIQEETRRHPEHVVRRLAPVLTGLRHVLVGGSLDDGSAPNARRLLGWSAAGHWMRSGS
ncbi:transcriptional regulator [Actinoallomurus purpureus]|uniref:transcriptional regulator n=1 Tax=Actinoallomurus purpureus TaxID=478114 RepID=UPI0020925E0C|nr:transcriptional regulator [Actinoallomurus purpureus]MCO6008228.1 transcriptional regulator [Actinoallomurus purpureus]